MIIENTVMHHFYDKKAHKGSHFRQIKKKKKHIGGIFVLFLQNQNFSEKFCCQFLTIKIL